MNEKKFWAVMCGAIRLEFEFYTTMGWLCEQRQKGRLEGIVLSTWKGEVERIAGLREALAKLQVNVVESPPLEQDVLYTDMAYLRQAKQLKAALTILPNDAFVLKCRTDYSNFDLNRLDSLMIGEEYTIGKWGDFDAGLKHRIKALRCGVSMPFACHDICFQGQCRDLDKLLMMEAMELSLGATVGPDVWFFAGYFVHEFPIVEDFFRYIKISQYLSALNQVEARRCSIELPVALNRFYALYFTILYQSFAIYHDVQCDVVESLYLEDVFCGNPDWNIRKDWLVEIRNYDVIRKIMDHEVAASEGYEKLYVEICRMKDNEYAHGICWNQQDYEELVAWGEQFLGLEADDWLNPFEKVASVEDAVAEQYGFDETIDLLMNKLELTEGVKERIRRISFSTQSYYGSIIQNLDGFKKENFELYKLALFVSTRYFDAKAMKDISELLLKGCLNSYEEEQASYVFRRYKFDDRLYIMPMSESQIETLYNYILFEFKKNGESEVALGFYNRLCSFFLREDLIREDLVRMTLSDINELKCLMQDIVTWDCGENERLCKMQSALESFICR